MLTFTKGNINKHNDDWQDYVKTVPTRMLRVKVPFACETKEGRMECPDGFVAIDAEGYPYPVAASIHAATYRESQPVTLTEGSMSKGGQNPPNISGERPPAPGGSGSCLTDDQLQKMSDELGVHQPATYSEVRILIREVQALRVERVKLRAACEGAKDLLENSAPHTGKPGRTPRTSADLERSIQVLTALRDALRT